MLLKETLRTQANGTVINPEALISSANDLSLSHHKKETKWRYSVSNLELRVQAPQQSRPSNCDTLLIKINLDLEGDISLADVDNPTEMVLNLLIQSDSNNNICAWHFDRHIQGSNQTVEAHPLFHFQHGGHAMEIYDDQDLGQLLLLPAPRFAHPPMDAILAIDFVLSNFAVDCWQKLREDTTYARILKDAQRRCWLPYIKNIASWWDNDSKDKDGIKALFPLLA